MYVVVVDVAVAVTVDVEVPKRNSLASLKCRPLLDVRPSSLGNTVSDLKYQIIFFIDDIQFIHLLKKPNHECHKCHKSFKNLIYLILFNYVN